jgi:hypothetical protein
MNRKTIILFLLCFGFELLHGQNKYIGCGFDLGFKSLYQEGGLLVSTRFLKIDLHLGYSKGRFNGNGISTGMRYSFIDAKYQPFVGLAYSRNYGHKFLYSDGLDSAVFKIKVNNFFYGELGIVRKINLTKAPERPNRQDIMLLVFSFSYRYSPVECKPIYIEGYSPLQYDKYLTTRIGNGFGGSFSVIILLDKSKNSKEKENLNN